MKIFVSCATYELTKRLGIREASEAFIRQCDGEITVEIPAARLIHRLRAFGDLTLYHQAGSCLPKMRSDAADAFWRSEADVWVMVDDDVECTTETLRVMLKGLDGYNIVVLPCRLRGHLEDSKRVLINLEFSSPVALLRDGVLYRPCRRAGTGCMMVTRGALGLMREKFADLTWLNDEHDGNFDDPGIKLALFSMLRDDGGRWYSEDISFTLRARDAGIQILAPLSGASMHAGLALPLQELTNL